MGFVVRVPAAQVCGRPPRCPSPLARPLRSSRCTLRRALASAREKYGEDVSNEQYVKTLYQNILDREPDTDGYNYWVGQLNNGIEDRSELLLGFAESAENKALFTDMTGFG